MAVSRIDEASLNVNQYGNRNIIINGRFRNKDQRHSFASHTVSSGSDFFADRWGFYTDAGAFALSMEPPLKLFLMDPQVLKNL